MNFMRCENDHDTDLAFVPTTDIFKASHRFCSIARQSDKKDNKRIVIVECVMLGVTRICPAQSPGP